MYILHKRIELDYIENEFEEIDLERAIDEASGFFPEVKPQIEKLTQNLLHFFIEHPPNKPYKYFLTPHAIRFIQFVGKKLFNEHKHFPLRKTFQHYGIFKAEEINEIVDFESWYKLNFKNSSKMVIEDHLEAFKDLVNQAIIRLNTIVTSEDNLALENLDTFTSVFKDSVARSEEIKETLQLSGSLKSQIRIVVDYFENKILEIPHTKIEKEKSILLKATSDYERSLKIKNEVYSFFDIIEQKLDQIIERYIYADKQLSNFKENFRIRTQFQRNLRKFLEVCLKSAVYDRKEGLKFHNDFNLKSIPLEFFKFLNVKKYDNFIKKKSFVIPQEIDANYALQKTKSANKLLLKQEEIARQLNILKINLSKLENTDITKEFYRLLEETNDENIALKVVHDVLKYASKHKDYDIEIQQRIPDLYQDKSILIWQMNIRKK